MNIVLLGPPGAGKGTQAVMLSERLGLSHIATGDILRENVKQKTGIGEKAQLFMEKGELVPDDIVIEMALQRLISQNDDKGFILDGFPRTIYQAKKLDAALGKLNLAVEVVVYFKTSIKTVVFRLTGRRLCRECGANYHIVNMPPKKEGICDKCGAGLYQRKDDNEEAIKTRLEVYNSQTKELIDYYKKKGVLEEISGDLDAEALYRELAQILNDRD